MPAKFSFKTATGSYAINVVKNIVICTFNGACCELIAQRYLKSLTQIVKTFDGAPWAYLGDAQLHHAGTPQAESYLYEACVMSIENNCVANAFCLTSAVGISQLERIRQRVGATLPIQECLFDTVPLAIERLNQELDLHSSVT
ncbi:hypothetical protein [Paraglaciecola sp. 20A4]|uniref:hypothetical protein n=1 Tax=Paraglaciecola sp. 20A4 TaxID=2687288 RepID=UPI00140DD0C7|nr:hypothetical protein [Paraglaciecola sp. 20A4]